jgi:hypothetical protein
VEPDREALGIPGREAWPRVARLWAFSFAALVVWSRAGVFLHEAAGHALFWRAGGGKVTGIEVSLFGGGATWIDAVSRCPPFLFHMAGVFVNLAMGLGLGAALYRLLVRDARPGGWPPGPRRLLAEHLLAWGTLLCFAGATHYTVLGAFYGFGDPARYRWLWSPALALLVAATPVTFWAWERTLRPLIPRKGRLGFTGLIIAAVPLAAYASGLGLENRNFAALRAEEAAIARAVEAERARRLEEWRAEHGDERPPPGVTEVPVDEVERPFPLTALVLGLDAVFLGATLFWRRGSALPASAARAEGPVPVPWAFPLAAAGAVLLLVQVCL